MKKIWLYSESICPYSTAARLLLEEKGLEYHDYSFDDKPQDREQVSSDLGDWPMLPFIFIDGVFVGGFTELVELNQNERLD